MGFRTLDLSLIDYPYPMPSHGPFKFHENRSNEEVVKGNLKKKYFENT